MSRRAFSPFPTASSPYIASVNYILKVSKDLYNLSATVSHSCLIDSSADVGLVIVVVIVVTGLRRNFSEALNYRYINITGTVVIV